MAVVFILLAIGFLFTMNDTGGSQSASIGGAPTVLQAYGKSLDQQAYDRMGSRTLQLASAAGLNTYINYLMIPRVRDLQQFNQYQANYYNVSRSSLTANEIDRFVANRIIVQKAFADMGLYASEEEVSEEIKSLPGFAPAGEFNASAYSNFIQNGIGNLGMTEKDLREVVRESICLRKFASIIGGDLPETVSAMRSQFEAQMQTVTFSRVSFELADFIKKESPAEQDIKSYWESHQDAYQSNETRRINYVLIDVPTRPEAPQSELAEDATDEQKAAKEASDKAANAAKAEQLASDVKALKREMNELSQTFYDRIDEKKPLEFEKVIAEHGKTIVKTALFSEQQLPAELSQYNNLRGSVNQSSSLANAIFELSQSDDPYDLISDPLPVGANGWIIFTLEEIVEPTLLSYEDAKEAARTDFVAENARTQLKEAAQEAHKQITQSISDSQTFDTLAKQQGYTPIQIGPYSIISTPPVGEPSYRELHQTAASLNPGDISEVVDELTRSYFIQLTSRELETSEENDTRIQAAVDQSADAMIPSVFINWINHQYTEADVKGRSGEQ